MPSYAHPLKFFSEWISQSILSGVTASLCEFFQRITAKDGSHPSCTDMDFIDISSSDDEGEAGVKHASRRRSMDPGPSGSNSGYHYFPSGIPHSDIVGSRSGSMLQSNGVAESVSGVHNAALNGGMHGETEMDDSDDYSYIDDIVDTIGDDSISAEVKVPSPEVRKRVLPPSLQPQGAPRSSSRPSSQAYQRPSQLLRHETDLRLGPSPSSKPDYLIERTPASSSYPPMKQSDRRILPPSLQPMKPTTTSSASNKGGKQFQNIPLKIDGSNGHQSSDRSTTKNVYDVGEDDEVYIYKTSAPRPGVHSSGHGNAINIPRHPGPTMMGPPSTQDSNFTGTHRILPPWMIGKTDNGNFAVNSPHGDQHNPRDHTGSEDFGPMEHDERLVYEAVLEGISQPRKEAALPDGLLSVPLLTHQKIALAWLVQKEIESKPCSGGILADDQGLGKTVSMIALILKQMAQQKTFTSHRSVNTISEPVILDIDDNSVTEEKKPAETDQLKLAPVYQKGRPAAGTLVVCPASVLRQWARELDDKISNSAKLSVLLYYGSSRKKEPAELAKYDVVLTTYTIVTNEVPKPPLADENGDGRHAEDYGLTPDFDGNKKRKPTSSETNKKKKKKKKGTGVLDNFGVGPLAKVRWFRVILDEAQVIKNHRTQVAKACCGLRAKQRWCLSGTPLQNTIDDLFSYFRFLKYEPYTTYTAFHSTLKGPVIRNGASGYKKLQAVLAAVMLRRTKGTTINGKPIVALPPKSILVKKLQFSLEERSFYAGLEGNFKARIRTYDREGTLKQNYANLLLMLLRLRQACDHPLLVKDYDSDTSFKTSLDAAKKLPKDTVPRMLKQLEDSCVCILCSDPPEDAVVSSCGHVFCYECILERLSAEETMCPEASCNNVLGTNAIFSKATLKCCLLDGLKNESKARSEDYEEHGGSWRGEFISTKVSAVLEIVNSLSAQHASLKALSNGERSSALDEALMLSGTSITSGAQLEIPPKAIIFSQWTSMLDLLETSLNCSLVQYRRLDGSMTLSTREQAVKDFNTDPEVTVMLMSLKAGNLGLNMIAASHVILVDLWWNPTSEDQAIDRAHRIGQTRPVTVHRLTIEDTVEQRILTLQEKKRDMVSSVFGEDSTGKTATRLTVDDLRFLFRV